MTPVAFVVLAVLTVAAAITVVAHPNPVHSACALVVTLFLLAVFFAGLDAQLVAALQIIVYAGAIVVLFLFVIMLLNLQTETRALATPGVVVTALAGGLALATLLCVTLARAGKAPAADLPAGFGETAAVARALFTVYLLPFELTSVLLLVAIVGAVALARRGA
jgi:NADH-quinone oxidoreductase subunit J